MHERSPYRPVPRFSAANSKIPDIIVSLFAIIPAIAHAVLVKTDFLPKSDRGRFIAAKMLNINRNAGFDLIKKAGNRVFIRGAAHGFAHERRNIDDTEFR